MNETGISELRTLRFVLVLQSESLHNRDNRVFNRKKYCRDWAGQSDGCHNDTDVFKFLGTMAGKENDEQPQIDVMGNIDSNREGSTDKSETEYTKDHHAAGHECLKVYKNAICRFSK